MAIIKTKKRGETSDKFQDVITNIGSADKLGGLPASHYATKSTVMEETLAADSWTGSEAPFTYTLTVEGVTETSIQEILPSISIVTEQLEALQSANLQDGGQFANTIVLKAFGDVPTINIPIRVVLRGDM